MLPFGVLILQLCILIDTAYYGGIFTFAPWQFFSVNVLQNVASKYFGTKPWHWNFTHGIPLVLGVYTPIFGYGVYYQEKWSYCVKDKETVR